LYSKDIINNDVCLEKQNEYDVDFNYKFNDGANRDFIFNFESQVDVSGLKGYTYIYKYP
jgi:hypothetical protein